MRTKAPTSKERNVNPFPRGYNKIHIGARDTPRLDHAMSGYET